LIRDFLVIQSTSDSCYEKTFFEGEGRMLRREKRVEDQDKSGSVGLASEPRVVPVSRDVPRNEKTVIGENIFIEGSIRGEEHLLMEGSMKGSIAMPQHNFSMGTKGRFEGDILAQNVSISGQMAGMIRSQGKVEITKDADFLGEIKAKSISLEDGAYFKGTIELDREPHRGQTSVKGVEPSVQMVDARVEVQAEKPKQGV
jgi:cytoskeletal protein CcmA (bactofilin family)